MGSTNLNSSSPAANWEIDLVVEGEGFAGGGALPAHGGLAPDGGGRLPGWSGRPARDPIRARQRWEGRA